MMRPSAKSFDLALSLYITVRERSAEGFFKMAEPCAGLRKMVALMDGLLVEVTPPHRVHSTVVLGQRGTTENHSEACIACLAPLHGHSFVYRT